MRSTTHWPFKNPQSEESADETKMFPNPSGVSRRKRKEIKRGPVSLIPLLLSHYLSFSLPLLRLSAPTLLFPSPHVHQIFSIPTLIIPTQKKITKVANSDERNVQAPGDPEAERGRESRERCMESIKGSRRKGGEQRLYGMEQTSRGNCERRGDSR